MHLHFLRAYPRGPGLQENALVLGQQQEYLHILEPFELRPPSQLEAVPVDLLQQQVLCICEFATLVLTLTTERFSSLNAPFFLDLPPQQFIDPLWLAVDQIIKTHIQNRL